MLICGEQIFTEQTGKVQVFRENENYIIESTGNKGFDWFNWKISPNGSVTLSYEYTLPKGEYHFAGIGIDADSKQLVGKRWLGEGPYRIWKNRKQGGVLNVWDSNKLTGIPGEKWNYPEFEGCFAPWYWSVFRFVNQQSIAISNLDKELILGVLNPVNGVDPKFAIWHYPEEEGIYLFNCISAVGAKWKEAFEFGPSSQPTLIESVYKGSVRFQLLENASVTESVSPVKEIE